MTWRLPDDECPENPSLTAHMDICQPCPYFRGASTFTGRKGWKINCNWPRNGSSLAVRESLDDMTPLAIDLLVNR
jgi:hypothetical protein